MSNDTNVKMSNPVSVLADSGMDMEQFYNVLVHLAKNKVVAILLNRLSYQLFLTSKALKEIAYDLNFSNSSSFGKYIKAQTGMSPTEYREQLYKLC